MAEEPQRKQRRIDGSSEEEEKRSSSYFPIEGYGATSSIVSQSRTSGASIIVGKANAETEGIAVKQQVYNAPVHHHNYPCERLGSIAGDKLVAPKLYQHFVHLTTEERRITEWLEMKNTNKKGSLLRIHGPGSAGKTSLAIFAAGRSAEYGFRRALWIGADHAIEGEQTKTELIAKVKTMSKSDEAPVLLIIDDVQDDRVIKNFQDAEFVIVTTRLPELGKRSNFTVEDLPVDGLTEDESKLLLKTIMEEGVYRDLEELEKLPILMTLCDKLFKRFPLSVLLIGIRLAEDHCEWRDSKEDVDRYLDDMKEDFKLSEQTLKAKIHDEGISDYTGYEFNHTHAAIFSSLERLEKSNKESDVEMAMKYRYLTVHTKGKAIRPATMSVIWGMEPRKATEQLKEFSRRALLTDVGYSKFLKEREFVLHDLIFDVLDVWTSKSKQKLTKTIVRRYEEAFTSGKIKDADETFYRRFVSWCLDADELESALKIVCNLRHLAKRIGLRFTNGMYQDLSRLSKKRSEATAWRDVTGACLSFNAGDTKTALDLMIRIALLRPHQEATYKEALDIVKDEFPDRPYLRFHTRPGLKPGDLTLHPRRDLTGLPKCWGKPVVDINSSGEVAVSIGTETFYYDDTQDSMKSKFKSRQKVLLLKWIDDNFCLLVTGDGKKRYTGKVTAEAPVSVEVVERRGDGWESAGRGRVLVDSGRMEDVKYAGGFLWLLVDGTKLRRFKVTGTEISEMKEHERDVEKLRSPRLTVSRSGNICAVSGSASTCVVVEDGVKEPRRLNTGGDEGIVVAILKERRLLMASVDEEKGILSIHDMDKSSERHLSTLKAFDIDDFDFQVIENENKVIIRVYSYPDSYHSVCLESGKAEEFNLLTSNDYSNFGDDIILQWKNQGLTLYSTSDELENPTTVVPDSDIPSDCWILLVEWWEEEEDFVAVYRQKQKDKFLIVARLLLQKKGILSVSTSEYAEFLSFSGGRLAVIFKSRVEEFDLRSGQQLWSLALSGVTAVDHGKDGLWVVVENRRSLLMDGKLSATFEMNHGDVRKVRFVEDDICVCEYGDNVSLTVWRGADSLFSRQECWSYDIDPRARRVVVATKSGVYFWNLNSREEKQVWSEWKIRYLFSCQILFRDDGQKIVINIKEFCHKRHWFVVDVEDPSDVTEIHDDLIDVREHIIAFSKSHLFTESSPTISWKRSLLNRELRLIDYRQKTSLFLTPHLNVNRICVSPDANVAVAWCRGNICTLDVVQQGNPPLSHLFFR